MKHFTAARLEGTNSAGPCASRGPQISGNCREAGTGSAVPCVDAGQGMGGCVEHGPNEPGVARGA
jgi:hypothetical protein